MRGKGSKLSFDGQTIYVGLDVGKKSWKVSIYTEEFEHKTFSQPPRSEVLVRYLRQHFPGATYRCVYEAGYFGYWIHDALQESGVECLVVHPSDVPTTDKEKRNRNDRVDARKLARTLRSVAVGVCSVSGSLGGSVTGTALHPDRPETDALQESDQSVAGVLWDRHSGGIGSVALVAQIHSVDRAVPYGTGEEEP